MTTWDFLSELLPSMPDADRTALARDLERLCAGEPVERSGAAMDYDELQRLAEQFIKRKPLDTCTGNPRS